MMIKKHCLNCGKELTDRYCSGCGQKADIKRITFKNFITHDVLHGIFHIEKGILFTAKQSLIRPGKAALDYISGRRKPYYNLFLLILLTIGLIIFLRHFYDEILIRQGREFIKDTANLNKASKIMDNIFAQKSKIVILLFVPLAAINSSILFRRKGLNLSEQSIIAGMILLGILILSVLFIGIFYFNLAIEFSNTFANIINIFVVLLFFIYISYGYFNAFGADYSKLEFAFRIFLFFTLVLIEIIILFFITFGLITNWKFGEITISLFE